MTRANPLDLSVEDFAPRTGDDKPRPNRESIDKVAKDAETNKSEILRKALQLFLAAHEGKRQGLKIGLVEPKTDKLKTEIIGL